MRGNTGRGKHRGAQPVLKTSARFIEPYVTRDGSLIRELMHPDRHGGRSLSLAAAEIGPGKVTALHRHPLAEEIYHVVSGMGLLTLGAERIVIEHGDTVCIMPGTEHRVENTGGETLIILCCCTPPYSHDDTEIL